MQYGGTITIMKNSVIVPYFPSPKTKGNADVESRRAVMSSTVACSRVKFQT